MRNVGNPSSTNVWTVSWDYLYSLQIDIFAANILRYEPPFVSLKFYCPMVHTSCTWSDSNFAASASSLIWSFECPYFFLYESHWSWYTQLHSPFLTKRNVKDVLSLRCWIVRSPVSVGTTSILRGVMPWLQAYLKINRPISTCSGAHAQMTWWIIIKSVRPEVLLTIPQGNHF